MRVATLEALKAQEGLPQPDLIKIDVEGGEGAVLRGAGNVLRSDTAVFVSVHGRTCYDECASLLAGRDTGSAHRRRWRAAWPILLSNGAPTTSFWPWAPSTRLRRDVIRARVW